MAFRVYVSSMELKCVDRWCLCLRISAGSDGCFAGIYSVYHTYYKTCKICRGAQTLFFCLEWGHCLKSDFVKLDPSIRESITKHHGAR